MKDLYDESIARTSFALVMLAIASIMAFSLGIIGVYGVLSYVVSQRTREIGIRLALGAAAGDVFRMVIGKGVALALVGLVVGLIAAFGLTTFVRGMLFGVSASDWQSYAATGLITLLAVLAASYVPARRAMGVQPVDALRS